MKKIASFLLMLFIGFAVSQAQMNTDNSYLRTNYNNSKTAKKAAEKKALKAAKKAEKEAGKEAKAQKQTTKESTKVYKGNYNQPTKTTKQTKTPQQLLQEEQAYLQGAVPTTAEGVVCFEKSYQISNSNKNAAYQIMRNYAEELINNSGNKDISRILSESGDTVVATISVPVYFKRKKWEADSTILQYQYYGYIKGNTATLRIWMLRYCYEQSRSAGFNYRAEELITDEYGLNKDKTRLSKVFGKFRRKTVDYVNGLLDEFGTRLNPTTAKAEERTVSELSEPISLPYLNGK